MYLLGIAELMANTRMEVTDRLSGIAAAVRQAVSTTPEPSGTRIGGVFHQLLNYFFSVELQLDDCGLRFVMIMQLYSYLCGTLPLAKRNQMMVTPL